MKMTYTEKRRSETEYNHESIQDWVKQIECTLHRFELKWMLKMKKNDISMMMIYQFKKFHLLESSSSNCSLSSSNVNLMVEILYPFLSSRANKTVGITVCSYSSWFELLKKDSIFTWKKWLLIPRNTEKNTK